jgi:hypothetical protein
MVILSIVPPLKLAPTVTLAMHEMSTVPLWVTVTTTVEASPVAVMHGEPSNAVRDEPPGSPLSPLAPLQA